MNDPAPVIATAFEESTRHDDRILNELPLPTEMADAVPDIKSEYSAVEAPVPAVVTHVVLTVLIFEYAILRTPLEEVVSGVAKLQWLTEVAAPAAVLLAAVLEPVLVKVLKYN